MANEFEIWKSIDNFPNYEVSSTGKIRSLRYLGHNKVKELVAHPDAKGYLRIGLTKDGAKHTFKVHRLVAQAFIDNPENKSQVNHKDGNKVNNRADNLEWCTAHDNVVHAYQNGLKERNREYAHILGNTVGKKALEKHRETQKTPIYAINIDTGEKTWFASQSDAANAIGACQSNVYHTLVGKQKSCMGYRFVYAERGDSNA